MGNRINDINMIELFSNKAVESNVAESVVVEE